MCVYLYGEWKWDYDDENQKDEICFKLLPLIMCQPFINQKAHFGINGPILGPCLTMKKMGLYLSCDMGE